jgi:N-methylhydantoinase A/oxoprolinase/acetone carboxylase beta subunit
VFETDGEVQTLSTPVFERERMPIDRPIDGPAIVVQLDSTTVVPPGATVRRDAGGNLLITL